MFENSSKNFNGTILSLQEYPSQQPFFLNSDQVRGFIGQEDQKSRSFKASVSLDGEISQEALNTKENKFLHSYLSKEQQISASMVLPKNFEGNRRQHSDFKSNSNVSQILSNPKPLGLLDNIINEEDRTFDRLNLGSTSKDRISLDGGCGEDLSSEKNDQNQDSSFISSDQFFYYLKDYDELVEYFDKVSESLQEGDALNRKEFKKIIEIEKICLEKAKNVVQKFGVYVRVSKVLFKGYQIQSADLHLLEAIVIETENKIEVNKENAEIFRTFYNLRGEILVLIHGKKSESYLECAEKITHEFFQEDLEKIAEGKYYKGKLYHFIRRYQESEKCLQEARQYYQNKNDKNSMTRIDLLMFKLYIQWSNFQKALSSFIRGFEAIQENGCENYLMGKCIHIIGKFYYIIGKKEQSIDCYKKSFYIFKKTLKNSNTMKTCLRKEYYKNFKEKIKMPENSLNLEDLESCKRSFSESFKFQEKKNSQILEKSFYAFDLMPEYPPVTYYSITDSTNAAEIYTNQKDWNA